MARKLRSSPAICRSDRRRDDAAKIIRIDYVGIRLDERKRRFAHDPMGFVDASPFRNFLEIGSRRRDNLARAI